MVFHPHPLKHGKKNPKKKRKTIKNPKTTQARYANIDNSTHPTPSQSYEKALPLLAQVIHLVY